MARHFFASLTRNPISLVGTALAAASLTLIIALVIIQMIGFEGGPYLGILTFLVLPVFFATGLLLIREPLPRAKNRRCSPSST